MLSSSFLFGASHLPLKSLNFKEIRTRAELEESPGKEIKICRASSATVRTLVSILKAVVTARATTKWASVHLDQSLSTIWNK